MNTRHVQYIENLVLPCEDGMLSLASTVSLAGLQFHCNQGLELPKESQGNFTVDFDEV